MAKRLKRCDSEKRIGDGTKRSCKSDHLRRVCLKSRSRGEPQARPTGRRRPSKDRKFHQCFPAFSLQRIARNPSANLFQIRLPNERLTRTDGRQASIWARRGPPSGGLSSPASPQGSSCCELSQATPPITTPNPPGLSQKRTQATAVCSTALPCSNATGVNGTEKPSPHQPVLEGWPGRAPACAAGGAIQPDRSKPEQARGRAPVAAQASRPTAEPNRRAQRSACPQGIEQQR